MKEALKLALEMLKDNQHLVADNERHAYVMAYNRVIERCEEALAQPEQKPVAWMLEGWGPDCGPYFEIYRDDEMGWRDKKAWTPLYTAPPQRQPLTDDEIWKFWCLRPEVPEGEDDSMEAEFVATVRAVLAAHDIKE